MDKRDDNTWVVIELTSFGEQRVEEDKLEEMLRQDLGVDGNFPIFIPSASFTKDGKTVTLHLVEGYCFVASGLAETSYFALERRPYVASIMSSRSGPHKIRTLSVVPNTEVESLRAQLRRMLSAEIEAGAVVYVNAGKYKRMTGSVVGFEGEDAVVHFSLRSLEGWAVIPRIFLERTDSV